MRKTPKSPTRYSASSNLELGHFLDDTDSDPNFLIDIYHGDFAIILHIILE